LKSKSILLPGSQQKDDGKNDAIPPWKYEYTRRYFFSFAAFGGLVHPSILSRPSGGGVCKVHCTFVAFSSDRVTEVKE
jgi:hypothetical protein